MRRSHQHPDSRFNLFIVAAIHGNEDAGVKALENFFHAIPTNLPVRIEAMVGNPDALAQGSRFLDRDLNRCFIKELGSECREIKARDRLISELKTFREHDSHPLLVLDLHTFSAPGLPFCCTNQIKIPFEVPVPSIHGLVDSLPGTFLSYCLNHQIPAIAFESGQHQDPASVARHEAFLWYVLEQVTGFKNQKLKIDLLDITAEIPRDLHISYRHALDGSEEFKMRPGFFNLQEIFPGQIIADDKSGEITAKEQAWLLMPLYQKLGNDGFFLCKDVD